MSLIFEVSFQCFQYSSSKKYVFHWDRWDCCFSSVVIYVRIWSWGLRLKIEPLDLRPFWLYFAHLMIVGPGRPWVLNTQSMLKLTWVEFGHFELAFDIRLFGFLEYDTSSLSFLWFWLMTVELWPMLNFLVHLVGRLFRVRHVRDG